MIRIAFALVTFVALSGAAPISDGDKDFTARILLRHNAERAAVGVPPLAWDGKLASEAASWAKNLAATRRLEHAPDVPDAAPEGENLWMGTSKAYSIEDMVDGWIEERRYYRSGLFPNITATRDWSDVGHYTQLIWHSTTLVGCALATGGGDDVLVCRYSPAGNWDGESPTGAALSKALQKAPEAGRRIQESVASTSFANASAR
jgi:Cysteine-rich secretory protein family